MLKIDLLIEVFISNWIKKKVRDEGKTCHAKTMKSNKEKLTNLVKKNPHIPHMRLLCRKNKCFFFFFQTEEGNRQRRTNRITGTALPRH